MNPKSVPSHQCQYRRLGLLAIVGLVALRLVIGFHFFQEGLTKVRSGKFTSAGFLGAAKGPLADHFHNLLPDYDGLHRLQFLLFAAEDFVTSDDAKSLGKDPKLKKEFTDIQKAIDVAELSRQQTELDKLLPSLESATAESLRAKLAIFHQQTAETYVFSEEQNKSLSEALARSKWQVGVIYANHSKAIGEYLRGFERRDKLAEDPARDGVMGVSSLASQREEIQAKWQAGIRPVLSDIDKLIENIESRIQSLATVQQQLATRPPNWKWPSQSPISLEMVDQIIPIFDMVIGILLLLGLLTPIASLAAGLFLVSVVLSQFPGTPGAQPTYFQAVEAIACFLLAFSDAGRYGGLDYLSWTWWKVRKFGGWQPE